MGPVIRQGEKNGIASCLHFIEPFLFMIKRAGTATKMLTADYADAADSGLLFHQG